MATTGEVITYAQLDAEANRLSHVFRAAGLQPGDHMALCMENHPRFLSMIWGAHYAGLYYTAMSSRLTTEEMAYILEDCGAQAFVTTSYKAEQAADLVAQMPGVKLRLMIDGAVDGYDSYEAAIEAAPAAPLDEERVEGQDMLYSSGTTGRPKGVKIPLPGTSLGDHPDSVTALGQMLFGTSADTMYLSPAPLYHAAPLRFCRGVHRLGGTVLVMEHFDPEQYLQLVERHQATFTQVVPTMFIRLLKLPEEVRSRYDVSSLAGRGPRRRAVPGRGEGEDDRVVGPDHPRVLRRHRGQRLRLHEQHRLAGAPRLGGPSPRRNDPHRGRRRRRRCRPVSRARCTSRARWPRPSSTTTTRRRPRAPATRRAGAGRRSVTSATSTTDGFLYLTDRKAYMIITGGVNVYPQEAENVLAMHPKVNDVAVFGVPNEDFGEEVKAVVEPASMDDAGPELERELIAYCKEHLADVKCPRSVDFRPELPRHPTGKLYKRLLKDEYWADAGRTI